MYENDAPAMSDKTQAYSNSSRTCSRLVVLVSLLALAGSLRFYKLGDWPFAGDETATLQEQSCLFGGVEASQDTQTFRLPRLIPLSYSLIHFSCALFGPSEFGSRVVGAILGALIVPIVFLLLEGWKGRPTAIAASLMVTLWPEHIFQSQQTRFYIIVGFFSFLSVLVGALAVRRRSIPLVGTTCCLVFAAILCHTVTAALLGIIFLGMLAASYAERQPVSKGMIMVFLAATACIAGFFVAYVWPLMQGWNQGATWGYSISHSVLASVNMIGWPIFLLAALGGLYMLCERNAENWYWIVCALGWGAVTVALPRMVSYQPAYAFPFALSVIVLAGCAIGLLYERLRERGVWLASAGVILVCLMNLPSLASHYVDGSRTDLRTAARYVERNWMPGDRVTGSSMGRFGYYAPKCSPRIPLPHDSIQKLEKLSAGNGRLWIVVQSTRGGLREALRRWLRPHC